MLNGFYSLDFNLRYYFYFGDTQNKRRTTEISQIQLQIAAGGLYGHVSAQIFRSQISMDLFIFQSHIHSFIYLFVICFDEMLMIQHEDSVIRRRTNGERERERVEKKIMAKHKC